MGPLLLSLSIVLSTELACRLLVHLQPLACISLSIQVDYVNTLIPLTTLTSVMIINDITWHPEMSGDVTSHRRDIGILFKLMHSERYVGV